MDACEDPGKLKLGRPRLEDGQLGKSSVFSEDLLD